MSPRRSTWRHRQVVTWLMLALVIWLQITPALRAQQREEYERLEPISGRARLNSFGTYVLAEYYGGGRGTGFQRNAGRVSLFHPHVIEDTFFLGQFAVGFTNHGDPIINLGVAARQTRFDDQWIIGLNAFLDGDHRFVNTYQQAGMGIELLSERLDLRANAYFPFGQRSHVVSDITFTLPYYRGHDVFLDGFVHAQAAMRGFDAGFALPLPGYLGERGIRGGADYYYFIATDSEPIHGVRGRVYGNITNDIAGQLILQHDRKYGFTAMFGFSIALPGGTPEYGGATTSPNMYERLSQPVHRNFQIVVDNQIIDTDQLAIDADTQLPYRVVHVSSAAALGGDGTFENPLARIADATAVSGPGDIILVHRGSVFDSQGLLLQDRQRLLGDGIPHPINTEQLGVINLAPVGDMGPLPLLTNLTGDGISLANNNEVAGFTLDSGTRGISALTGADGSHLHDLTIRNMSIAGIEIVPSTNTTIQDVIFENNAADIVLNAQNTLLSGITSNNVGGTSIRLGGAGGITGFATLEEIQINNAGGRGIELLGLATNATITDTNIVGADEGIRVEDSAAGSSLNIVNSSVSTSGTHALSVRNGAGTVTVASTSSLLDAGDSVLHAIGGSANIDVEGTVGQTNAGLLVHIASGHLGTIQQLGGTMSATSGGGMRFDDADGSYVFNSTVSLSGTGGIEVVNGSSGTIVLGTGASITNGTGTSVRIANSSANFTYSGLITQSNALALIEVNSHASGTVRFATGTLTASNGSGLQLTDANGLYQFAGTTTLNGGDAGVDIIGGTGTFEFDNLNITDPSGIAFQIVGGSSAVTVNGSITQNNPQSLIDISDHTVGTIRFNTGSLNATNGDGIQLNNAAGIYEFAATTTLSGGDAGIDILNSTGTFEFQNATVTSPTGIAFRVDGGSAAVTYSGNLTQNNNAALVSIANHDVGAIAFNGGALHGTSGTGLQFNDADGNYSFNSTVTLNGGDAGIDILNDSGGDFTFANASIVNPSGAGLSVDNFSGSLNYIGSIQANLADVAHFSNIAAGASITSTAGSNWESHGGGGLLLSSVAGSVSLNAPLILNNSVGGIQIENSSGELSLAAATITDPNALTSAAVLLTNNPTAQISFGSLNVNSLTNGVGGIQTDATTLNISTGDVTVTAAQGLSVIGAATDITLNSLAVVGASGAAISLDDVSGAISLGSTTVNDPASVGLTTGLAVTNSNSLAANFGATSIEDVAGNGISLDTNNGSSFTFESLNVANTNGTGLLANDSGTVTINGAANQVSTINGSALHIASTSLSATLQNIDSTNATDDAVFLSVVSGSLNVTGAITATNPSDTGLEIVNSTLATNLARVDVNGGVDGIRLTDTSGAISVSGSGTAGSGGTIQGTSNSGIQVINSAGSSFSFMELTGTAFGLDLTAAGTDAVAVSMLNNEISSVNGVRVQSSDLATIDLTLNDNTISSTGGGSNDFAMRIITGANGGSGVVTLQANRNVFAATATQALSLNGTGGGIGSIVVSAFDGNQASGINGGGGMTFNMVDFDSGAGAAVVALNTGIGSAANPVGGNGIAISNSTGEIQFGELNIFNTDGAGLSVDASNPISTNFTISTSGGTVISSNGPALSLNEGLGVLSFASLTSNDSVGAGLQVTQFGGDIQAGAVTVTNSDGSGIEIAGMAGRSVSLGDVVISNAGQSAGHAIDVATNNSAALFTFNSINANTDNGTGLLANDSGTINIIGAADVSAIGGPAVDLNATRGQTNGVDGWTFSSLTSRLSPNRGILLTSLTDNFTVTGATTVDGATGTSILLDGDNDFSFGSTTVTNRGFRGIEILGTSGAVGFGDTTISGAGNASVGVSVANANSGSVHFDSLSVTGSGGTSIDLANNSAPFSISGNTIVSLPGGIGINITNSSSATFGATSISGRSDVGINMVGTGGTYQFGVTTISGPGGSTSGVVYANSTGGSVVFDNLSINDSGKHGLELQNNAGNFTVTNDLNIDNATDVSVSILAGSGNIGLGTTVISGRNTTGLVINGTSGQFSANSLTIDNSDGAAGSAVELTNLQGSGAVFSTIDIQNANVSALLLNSNLAPITVNGGSIIGAGGSAVDIAQGSGDVTIGAAITNSNGRSINILNRSGGLVTFSGFIDDDEQGIHLENNIGTIAFTGGMDLNTNQVAFTAISVGQININGLNDLRSTAGPVLDISHSNINATFNSLFSTGSTTNGIKLDTVGGTLAVSGTTQVINPEATAILVENSPGIVLDFGSTTITGAGSVAGHGVDISNNNAGATLTFDTLEINTANGSGLVADNSGTININSTDAIIGAVGGAAVDIVGTTGLTNGTSGWTFQQLTSLNSAGDGIRLQDLTDSFVVTGATSIANQSQSALEMQGGTNSFTFNGVSITNRNGAGINILGTGGTIQLGDVSIEGQGGFDSALEVANTTGGSVTLSSLNIQDGGDKGIELDSNLALFRINGGTTIDSTDGSGIFMTGIGDSIFGAITITNREGRGVELSSAAGTHLLGQVSIIGDGLGSPGLDITNSGGVINLSGLFIDAAGGTGMLVESSNTTINVSGNTTIQNGGGDALIVQNSAGNIGLNDVLIKDNAGTGITLSNNTGDFTINAGGEISQTVPNGHTAIQATNIADLTLVGTDAGTRLLIDGGTGSTGATHHGVTIDGAGDVTMQFVTITEFGEPGGSDQSNAIRMGPGVASSLSVTDTQFSSIEGSAINVSPGATLSGEFNLTINNNTFTNIGTDAASQAMGIHLNATGSATADRVVADFSDNTFTGVGGDIIHVQLNGTAGGVLARNTFSIDNIDGTNSRGSGISIQTNDNAVARLDVNDGSIFGVGTTTNTSRGLDVNVDGSSDLEVAVSGLVLNGFGDEGVALAAQSGSSATLTTSLAGMTINNMSSASFVATNSGSTTMNLTLANNTATGNLTGMNWDFNASSGSVTRLNLNSNDDAVGYSLTRDADGILQLGGSLGTGSSFDDDNGNIANNGNTTALGPPNITINGTGNQIQIVDPVTIPTP